MLETAPPSLAESAGGPRADLLPVPERQLRLLQELAVCAARAQSVDEAWILATEALAGAAPEIPFAAVYLVQGEARSACRAAAAGLEAAALPPALALEAGPGAGLLAPEASALEPVPLAIAARAAGRAGPGAAGLLLGRAGDGQRAILVLGMAPGTALDPDRRRFHLLVGAQVAAAMTRGLACAEERRRQEAETLHEVARDLASELDVEQLLQKVTDAATRLAGARFGAYFWNSSDARGAAYRLFTLSGAPREAFETLGMPRATPIFKPTFLGQGPVRIADVLRDPRYGRESPHHGMPPGHLPVRSYLAVPVISRRGEVLGGLFFGHPEPGVFDEHAERSVAAIAAQAAVAIDNAHLFAQAREEIDRRARIERELRDSERRSRELVDALPAAVYTTDGDGVLQHYNPAAERLWGRRPEAGVERWCGSHAIYLPDGRALPHEECFMARTVRGEPGAGASVEVVIERPDGSLRHVLAHPRAMHDAQGRPCGAVNMLVDITGRKEAEAELAATKDQLAMQVDSLTRLHELSMQLGGMGDLPSALQAILDAAVAGQGAQLGIVWLHDAKADELVIEASRNFDAHALAGLHRVPCGEAGGSAGHAFAERRHWTVFDTEADLAFAPFREVARRAGFRAVHSTPIVTRSGGLLGVISVHYARPRGPRQHEQQLADVCARYAADAIESFGARRALRDSERLYRAIGESIDYGVWVCDPEGRNVYQSESMLRLVGRGAEEHRGHGWLDVLHPADREASREAWEACVRSGGQFDREFRVRGADGEWHPILSRGVPVRDESGTVIAWAGIALDIARLKQAENELRELDQRKNEFLATLAHELRNPLAPLRNGLEVMRLASGEPRTVERARAMMERQLAQMVRLVDDLLDVSRVSRGKIELRRADVALDAVLRSALETSQPLMAERGHTLAASIPPERIVVHADTTRLAQVFWNLLNNAARYTEPPGHIELAVAMGEDTVEVRVSDDGIGIPKDMLERVFDIFTQVDRSLEKSQGGLGIGLSIARRLVQMHGGTIEARSDGPGRGSQFVVRLPARVARGEDARAGTSAPAAPARSRRRVLVADDNRDSALTLSIMLEAMGNEVRVAHDGEEAVAVAAAFRPDAILLDIGMPRMNGYDACARIRREPWASATTVVALTGWGQDADKSRSRAAGFDRHLVKPVEPATLAALLEALPARGAARG